MKSLKNSVLSNQDGYSGYFSLKQKSFLWIVKASILNQYLNILQYSSVKKHGHIFNSWFLLHCIFAKYFWTRYYTYISFLYSRWMSIRWLVPEYGFHAKVQFIYPSVFWDSMLKPNLFPQLFHCYLGISLCLKKRFQVSRCQIKPLIWIIIKW